MFRLSVCIFRRREWTPAEFIAFDTGDLLFERYFNKLRVLSAEEDCQGDTWLNTWKCNETFTVEV
jgi:hypothetical protein